MMVSYKDLIIWQKSFDLVIQIYTLTKSLPKEEQYGLISQMRRAAVSIPSNIAEGHSRKGTKEYLRYAIMAFGSACELETQLLLADALHYCDKNELDKTSELLTENLKILNSIITTLKGKLKAEMKD